LENNYAAFTDASLDDLIKHAVKALASSLSGDSELDIKSASVAIVGKDQAFHFLEGAPLQRYLDEITTEETNNQPTNETAMELETPQL
jgi:20S proteasome subunit alpha 6